MRKSLLTKLLCENLHRNIRAASRLPLYGYVPVSSRIHALLLVVQRVVFSEYTVMLNDVLERRRAPDTPNSRLGTAKKAGVEYLG